MNSTWNTFLSQNGAEFSDSLEARFISDYDPSKTQLFDLSYKTLLKITGADAEEFLHGQFSNDLKGLDGVSSQVSSYSNPKGRLLSIFRITRVNDFYLMSFPADISEPLIKRLQMFIMRSAVKVENISSDWVSIGLSGEGADRLLTECGYSAPGEVDGAGWVEASSTLVVRVPGEVPRFEVFAPSESMKSVWENLGKAATPASTAFWKLQQIEAGQADIYAATQESFVAQMVNLHITGAVNFKKGCFPGQEIIARLQYLGKLKRKMYRYSADIETLPAPGTVVIVKETSVPTGTVVESAPMPGGGFQVLLVLKAADVEGGNQLQLQGDDKADLTLLSLPYAFGDDE